MPQSSLQVAALGVSVYAVGRTLPERWWSPRHRGATQRPWRHGRGHEVKSALILSSTMSSQSWDDRP
jgi:hypothetical protein